MSSSETPVIAKLQALKDRIADLQSRRGRLQAEAEGAKQQMTVVMGSLKEKFGVKTLDEAKKLAREKSDALKSSIDELDSQLKAHE